MSLKMRDIFYRMLDGQSTLDKNNKQQLHIIFKMTSPKIEDNSPKIEDDLTQNGRRPQPK